MMTSHVTQKEIISGKFVINISSMYTKGRSPRIIFCKRTAIFKIWKILPVPYRSKIDPNNMDKTLHAVNTISGLLQGPFDVGNALVGHQGVMEMMVALCGSEREVDQMVAVEALIHSSTKMSRASFIITNGVSLLKDIYKKTTNEKIKIRALVVSGPQDNFGQRWLILATKH